MGPEKTDGRLRPIVLPVLNLDFLRVIHFLILADLPIAIMRGLYSSTDKVTAEPIRGRAVEKLATQASRGLERT